MTKKEILAILEKVQKWASDKALLYYHRNNNSTQLQSMSFEDMTTYDLYKQFTDIDLELFTILYIISNNDYEKLEEYYNIRKEDLK